MRLATFNVNSMFERPKAMNLETWQEGAPILNDFSRLNALIQEPIYTAEIKSELLEIMKRNKGLLSPLQKESKYIVLREVRGRLYSKPKSGPAVIVANGREAWIGWFELLPEPIKETAIENTARIVGLLQADVMCLVEVEDRTGLVRFTQEIMPQVGASPFQHVMVISGNDDRGINVGIMSRQSYGIVRMLSHVDDTDADGQIFSRDCAEYEIRTANNNTLLLLVNHFKSKGYGPSDQSDKKRCRQATRVRAIYEEYTRAGYEYIAIVGDLNETPAGPSLDPLLHQASPLTDIMTHPNFAGDGRPGTYGDGKSDGKFDYILMSPQLAAHVTRGGIERQGVWSSKNGTRFPHLPTIKTGADAASDHAALWAELDI